MCGPSSRSPECMYSLVMYCRMLAMRAADACSQPARLSSHQSLPCWHREDAPGPALILPSSRSPAAISMLAVLLAVCNVLS